MGLVALPKRIFSFPSSLSNVLVPFWKMPIAIVYLY